MHICFNKFTRLTNYLLVRIKYKNIPSKTVAPINVKVMLSYDYNLGSMIVFIRFYD